MNNSCFQFSDKVVALSDRALRDTAARFREIDAVAQACTEKVLAAFQKNRVSDACFGGTTGYGYDDRGRETLDRVYADVFGTEAGLVRIGFVNGTHAITSALFSVLRPGDTLVAGTGRPYDTLCSAIGIAGHYTGSLKDFGVRYEEIPLKDGRPDIEAIVRAVREKKVKMVALQRSRGYSARDAFSVGELSDITEAVHAADPDTVVFTDNCYGEFTECEEPRADLMAGSLIKNPGGGLAPTGGYIVGRSDLVEAASYRMTTPGIGGECGATLGNNRLLFQGLFLAPHTTAQAMKTAVFCARMMELLGYKTSPASDAPRSDIVQTVELGSPEALRRFCLGIQRGAPVDAYVTPEPWDMPGYDDKVIMAAGAFIQGASIELSADGPMREPYMAFLQGGLTFESGRLGVMLAAECLLEP
ncbi:MAG: methionine gamma-lyase family protein [Oscillospiraceae bacterium]|nr:methionine gamma-lyase family protein [Oscillospiraceae bacterium]